MALTFDHKTHQGHGATYPPPQQHQNSRQRQNTLPHHWMRRNQRFFLCSPHLQIQLNQLSWMTQTHYP